jgi:hypothetical protein
MFLNSTQCYSTWRLFLGGFNSSQAQAEAIGNGSGITNQSSSGFWYKSNPMSGSICARSCLKYGFIYAAINPL